MNIQCDIRIIPEKEKEIAILSFTLTQSDWIEQDALYQHLIKAIPSRLLLSYSVLADKVTLQCVIPYMDQENIMKKAVQILGHQPDTKVGRKQIFIKKLGGWFDI
jgi:hypothetical protein